MITTEDDEPEEFKCKAEKHLYGNTIKSLKLDEESYVKHSKI